jgi:hypothetical protein
MSQVQSFWTDQEYDREHAAEGHSRYGEAVRRNIEDFSETWGDIAPVAFACAAWRIATPPVMSPPFVRWHRRIIAATCRRNEWDGGLTAELRLASPLPAELAASREWWHDRGWRGWQEVFGQYVEPAEQDLAKSPYVRASLLIQAPLPLGRLPDAPADPFDDVEDTARRAVVALAKELSDLVAPIIGRLGA